MADTTLQAVNKVLRGLGEPPATALDTGGTSIEAEAEDMLDEQNSVVQQEGWAVTTEYELDLTIATRLLTVGAVTGTYTYDETVTEATTGATGKFKYLDGTSLYLEHVSGTFDGATRVLTGATSGATCTDSAVATITESKIAIDPAWLRIEPHDDETVNYVNRGSFLYDTDDNTTTFDADVKADVIKLQTFTDLPTNLQEYVIAAAALELADYKKRGTTTKDVLERKRMLARVTARQDDTRLRRVNVFDNPDSRRLMGRVTRR